jgi:lipopolysaccharide transport system ATP-binding protein
MGDLAIRGHAISKRYSVYDSQRARLMHALWPAHRAGVHEISALQDVDLEIAHGHSIAIIGRNGSGKSTLLQILTGTLMPTSGEVAVHGRVSALLELGSGFNPEYTGRDNVMMNGLILGLDRGEIVRRFREIEDFAEIGEAIDRPVKTYSSGMLMRLAFAVQVLTDPDILVVDEALSVGDFFFQQKCFGRIRALCDKGVTLVFVSHDMRTVRDLCKRTIYLREGRVAFDGDTATAIHRYLAERDETHAARSHPEDAQPGMSGELEAVVRDSIWRNGAAQRDGKLIAFALYDGDGRPATSFRMGETMRAVVAYRPSPDVPTHIGITLFNKYDQVVTSTGSAHLAVAPPAAQGAQVVFCDVEIGLALEAGSYSISVSLGNIVGPNRGEFLDYSQPVGPISIHWDYERELAPFLGMFGPRTTVRFRSLGDKQAG